MPDSPAAEVIKLLLQACGRAKVGTYTDGTEAFACSFCNVGEETLGVSDIDTNHDAVNMESNTPSSVANELPVETAAQGWKKLRSLISRILDNSCLVRQMSSALV